MAVKTTTDQTFSQDVGKGLVLVDFWAEWCAPCRMVAPIVEELSNELAQVSFTKVNVDENQLVAQQQRITHLPTLVLFKDGQAVDRITGLVPKAQLKSLLSRHTD